MGETTTSAAQRGVRLTVIDRTAEQFSLRRDSGEFHALYEALGEVCERIDLLTMSKSPAGHEEVDGKTHVHGVPYGAGARGHARFQWYGFWALKRVWREARPDLIWCMDPLHSAVLWFWARPLRPVPMMLAVRGDLYRLAVMDNWHPAKRWGIGLLTSLFARLATRVRVVGQLTRDDLVARGVAPERVIVQATPTRMELFHPAPHAQRGAELRATHGLTGERVLVFVGKLSRRKGVDLLLDALALGGEALAELRIVLVGGDGGELDALRAQAERLGLTGRVLFVGRVTHADVPAWLAAADAFVLPTRNEGLPRAAVEAAAMELPVLITDVSSNAEAVRHGQTGWLTAPCPEAIATALGELAALSDVDLRQMGRRARAFVEDRFGYEQGMAHMRQALVLDIARTGR